MSTYKITGSDAIRLAERDNLTLYCHANHIDDGGPIKLGDALAIVREDPGLVYVIVTPRGWWDGQRVSEAQVGHNVGDYWNAGGMYLGPDDEGIEPTFDDAPQAESTSTSIGINKWAKGREIFWIWTRGVGDQRMVGWQSADGERAIETNGDPVFEGEEGFEEAWELGMGIAAASASAETTGVGECVEGTWRFTSCGVKYKSIVLAAVARALVAAGLADEQFEITIYHADGRNITGDMPHAGTWIGLPV